MLVHYWGDAILTVRFINRMSSSSLENKVCYHILFPKDPFFHITPYCVCFIDKLLTRAIKRVLGYSRLLKGY